MFTSDQTDSFRQGNHMSELDVLEHTEGLITHEVANVPQLHYRVLVNRVYHWTLLEYSQQSYHVLMAFESPLFG